MFIISGICLNYWCFEWKCVIWSIQVYKVSLLRCLVKVNILSTISLFITHCDPFNCDIITEEGCMIARVGQTTNEDVWKGWTTRVGQLSTNHVVRAVEMMVCRQLAHSSCPAFPDIFISCLAYSSYLVNLLLFILSQKMILKSSALAIFAVNLRPMCQPVRDAKSRRYCSENASRCVCHELKQNNITLAD